MTKRNLLLASLLLVLGLGIIAPFASAQVEGNGTVLNVSPSLYTLRPNSIGDAGGQVYLTMASGLGTIAGGETFTITFSKPIVGAAGIAAAPNSEFCSDGTTALTGGTAGAGFCENMSFSAAGNVLTFTNGAIPVAGWAQTQYVVIWGLRFDTVGVPPGTFITATVGAVLNQNYPISFGFPGVTQSQTPVNIGQVATTSYGGTVYAQVGAPYYATSILTCFGTTGSDFTIDVNEQWAGAWTSLTDELTLAPYAPTASGLATNGSDISITFSGIPLGVTVAPLGGPATIPGDPSATWGTYSPLTYTGVKANDSVTFDFPIAATLRTDVEAASFSFVVSTSGAIALQNPPMTASVTLDPMTPTSTALYPAFTYPNGSLAEEPTYPLTVVDFIGCQTNLLFPYVTNYNSGPSGGALGNWDTGIVVSNTSSDPYGPAFGGAYPTAGTCAFSVYAASSGSLTPSADAAPVATFNTAPVYTGGIASFMLSGTAAKGLGGGYAIAVCNFLNGTGYAIVADNANGLGNWGVVGTYLAYVIPNPFEEPRWVDSIFGEFAISPWVYFYDYAAGSHRGSNGSIPKLRAPHR